MNMSVLHTPPRELKSADKLWHLKQSPLMQGLSFRMLATTASLCSDRIYAKAEVIFKRGDPSDALYILNRGSVRLSLSSPNGKEKIVALLRNGDVFGEEILSPSEERLVGAEAHQDSWVSIISSDHFLQLVQQQPALSLNLARILSERLDESRNDIEALTFLTTEQRVARALLGLARNYGRTIISNQRLTKIVIPLSHERLAQLIGGNRPQISTIMSSEQLPELRGQLEKKLKGVEIHLLSRASASVVSMESPRHFVYLVTEETTPDRVLLLAEEVLPLLKQSLSDRG